MPNSTTNIKSRTLKLAKMALMVAIAAICSFVQFPILPTAPYLRFELMDIPLLIAGFVFGPVRGFALVIVSILVRSIINMPDNSPYGQIMHIIALGVFVVVSSAIYEKFKTRKWGMLSLIIGGICSTLAMIPANIIVTTYYMFDGNANIVYGMILPVIIPFNLLKMVINTVVVFLLYKRLSTFLHGRKYEDSWKDNITDATTDALPVLKLKARLCMVYAIISIAAAIFILVPTFLYSPLIALSIILPGLLAVSWFYEFNELKKAIRKVEAQAAAD